MRHKFINAVEERIANFPFGLRLLVRSDVSWKRDRVGEKDAA